MKKKLSQFKVQKELIDKGILIFSPLEFRRLFDVKKSTAQLFLNRNLKKGFFVKLKNGLYALENKMPSELEIANRVYYPSYVSLEYAMSLYSIIPETIYSVTSVTTKPPREFVVNNILYDYKKIKKEAFSGYLKKTINNNIGFVADPEKALADYLYFVDLRKKNLNDRIDVNKLSKDKLIKYSKLFNRKSLLKLTKEVYDKQRRNKTIIY